MSEEELIETLKEFEKNRVEKLKEPSRNLFYAIMKIADERDKYKEILDKIKEYVENLLKEEFEITDPDNINYGEKCQRAYFSDSELEKILELLEEIE